MVDVEPALAPFLFESWSARADEKVREATLPNMAELDDALRAVVRAVRAEQPEIEISDADFVRHLGARLDSSLPATTALERLRAADLRLALACAKGDPKALRIFEQECMASANAAASKSGLSPDTLEEAKQILRTRLFFGDGSPKILDYDGRGDLRVWVRVSLMREAIHFSRRDKREAPLADELLSLPASDDDPEIAFFKSRYRAEYKAAFEAAVEKLSSRERALLRQQFVLGMTVEEIGMVYGVHKGTASRWLHGAREELLSKARMELTLRLGIPRSEIEEVLLLIESGLELSFRRLLGSRSTARHI